MIYFFKKNLGFGGHMTNIKIISLHEMDIVETQTVR